MLQQLTSKKIFFTFTLTVAGVFFVPFFLAHAVTISPARMELVADPGQIIESKLLLINDEKESKTFYTSVANFESQGETGTPSFVDSKNGLASWINVVESITLSGGESKSIPFSITTPTDVDAGGNFAAIFVSTVPPASSGSGQVSVGAKVGMLVLLRVNGDVKEGGGIASFNTLNNKRFFTELPISFLYRFQNTGSDRIMPRGDIVVRNMIGIKAETLSANEGQGNILPGSTRKFEVVWNKEESGKINEKPEGFFGHVAYQWNHFALGYYHAKIALVYGAAETLATESYGVFVFPWQLMIIIILILIALWFILSRAIKSYNKSIIAKAKMNAQL